MSKSRGLGTVFRTTRAETRNFTIHIAGDYDDARRICRKFCAEVGFCVSIEKTDYIYTGGEEAGVTVRLINYPRFPMSEESMENMAFRIGYELCAELYQTSFTIVGPRESIYVSRRGEET